jgi:hypothetical protein
LVEHPGEVQIVVELEVGRCQRKRRQLRVEDRHEVMAIRGLDKARHLVSQDPKLGLDARHRESERQAKPSAEEQADVVHGRDAGVDGRDDAPASEARDGQARVGHGLGDAEHRRRSVPRKRQKLHHLAVVERDRVHLGRRGAKHSFDRLQRANAVEVAEDVARATLPID